MFSVCLRVQVRSVCMEASGASHPDIWDRGSHWSGARNRLGWLTSGPTVSTSHAGLQPCATRLALIFDVSSGEHTQSQHLHGEHFTDWAISLVPPNVFSAYHVQGKMLHDLDLHSGVLTVKWLVEKRHTQLSVLPSGKQYYNRWNVETQGYLQFLTTLTMNIGLGFICAVRYKYATLKNKNKGSIPSTHTMAQNCNSNSRGPNTFFWPPHTCGT